MSSYQRAAVYILLASLGTLSGCIIADRGYDHGDRRDGHEHRDHDDRHDHDSDDDHRGSDRRFEH